MSPRTPENFHFAARALICAPAQLLCETACFTPVLLQCDPGGHGRQSPLLPAPGEARYVYGGHGLGPAPLGKSLPGSPSQ